MAVTSEAMGGAVSASVYRVLVADLAEGDIAALPAAQAVIWRAIDRLHAFGDAGGQIEVLEEVSRELHTLRHEPHRPPQAARARLATLTLQWLERAPLLQ